MPSTFEFSPFDRQLLKLAAERACDAAKTAKNAAKKAYLTEAESEAHEMEGYADEAMRFLDSPEAIARETAGEDATAEEKAEVVQLGFKHRAALRTGCLILIKDSQKIIDNQTEMFADTTGQHERLKDFQRLESRLRAMNSDQEELPLDATASTDTTDETPTTDDDQLEADLPEGPFDAPAAPERLALPSGQPAVSEIPEADFEIVDEAAIEDASPDDTDAFALDEDEHDDDDDAEDTPAAVASADADVEAWLAEPLRTTPEDAAEDDLTS